MNEDVKNLVESFATSTSEAEVGDECIYREGIVSVKVKVLEKKRNKDFLDYVILPIEVMSPSFLIGKMTKKFEIGKKDGFGYHGWSLRKI